MCLCNFNLEKENKRRMVLQNEIIATGAVLYVSFVWLSSSKLFHRQLRPIFVSLKPYIFWAGILSLAYYRFVTVTVGQEDSLIEDSLSCSHIAR